MRIEPATTLELSEISRWCYELPYDFYDAAPGTTTRRSSASTTSSLTIS
jgi:hypothetical protein